MIKDDILFFFFYLFYSLFLKVYIPYKGTISKKEEDLLLY